MKNEALEFQSEVRTCEANAAIAQDSRSNIALNAQAIMKHLNAWLLSLVLLAVVLPAHGQGQGVLASEFDTADSKLEIYFASNSNIFEIASGDPWEVFQITGLAGEGPSAAALTGIAAYTNTIYNGNEVFYLTDVNGNMDVEQLWGSSFSPTNLSAKTDAKPAVAGSNLVGYIDPIVGSDNVFYIGTDKKVHLLLWTPAGGWSSSTVDATAPAAVGTSLSGHMTSNSEEVFYLGSNRHVYELWRHSQNSDGWHLTDVTMANVTKPIAAAGSPLAGFYDSTAGTDSMFYLGTDQHVHELLFSTTGLWSGLDLTKLTGAQEPATNSRLAAHINTNNGGSEEVDFVDTSENVLELWAWSSSQTTWHVNSFPGREVAASGTPLSTDMSEGDDQIYYIGADDNIFEAIGNVNITTSAGAPNALAGTLIDFDTTPNGAAIANNSVVNNTYSSLGVTFESEPCPSGTFQCLVTTAGNAYAVATSAALSQPNVINTLTSTQNPSGTLEEQWGGIQANFNPPVISVSISVLETCFFECLGAPPRAFLAAYNSSGEQITYEYATGPIGANWQTLTVNALPGGDPIAFVQFTDPYGGTGNTYGAWFDNLVFVQ